MSHPHDDAEAPTLAASTQPERPSRPAIVDDALVPGQALGRYRLRARLGAGAMGVVWSARDPELDRDVAIKVVHPALVRSPEAASRFSREARAMAKLSHRAVVPVYDTGDVDGRLFLVMELVDGETLGRMLRRRDAGALADWPRWLAIMLDAGRGLAEAHAHGVLHRDFKPDNVLVDKAGRVCVGDFGLATLGDGAEVAAASARWTHALDLTTTGALLGTPIYMSPQQLRGEPVDARADQFAFCVATYEALYGTRPFSADRTGEDAIPSLLDAIERHELPPPPEGSKVPTELRDVLARGLAPDPAERWPDMDALLDALRGAARRRSPTVVARHRRRWIGAVAAAVGVAALIALGFAWLDRSPTVPDSTPLAPAAHPREIRDLLVVSLRTQIAISPDGKQFAIAGDRVLVGDIDGDARRGIQVPAGTIVTHVEFDGDEVVFSLPTSTHRYRWRYRTADAAELEARDVGGVWFGTTVAGDIAYVEGRTLGLVGHDGVAHRWGPADVVAISPDRRRVAYIEGGRFTGTIAVRDVSRPDHVIRSVELDEPVSLAWRDDTTLLYATGTLDHPRVQTAKVDADAVSTTPDTVLEEAVGWYGAIAFGGGRLLFQEMNPRPGGRVVDLDTMRSEDLDSVAIGLGWDADNRLIAWDRSMHDVELRAYPDPAGRRTSATLGAEPANATTANGTLIATLRRTGGREVVAYSLAHESAGPRWRGDDRRTLAVRCAGDAAPPCYALRLVSETRNEVVEIDPETGALGTDPIYAAPRIEDIAVTVAGDRLYVVGSHPLRAIDLATRAVTDVPIVDASGEPYHLLMTRSVAVGRDGTVFVASTVGRNRYEVGKLANGRYTRLAKASDQLLAFVRPSRDGKKLMFVARSYEPKLRVTEL